MSALPPCRRPGLLTPACLHCSDGSQAREWETVPEGTRLMCAAPMRHTEMRSGSDSSSSSSNGAEAARRGSLELGRAIGAICVGVRDDSDTDGDRWGQLRLVGGCGNVLHRGATSARQVVRMPRLAGPPQWLSLVQPGASTHAKLVVVPVCQPLDSMRTMAVSNTGSADGHRLGCAPDLVHPAALQLCAALCRGMGGSKRARLCVRRLMAFILIKA